MNDKAEFLDSDERLLDVRRKPKGAWDHTISLILLELLIVGAWWGWELLR